jgi:hypothetical protein
MVVMVPPALDNLPSGRYAVSGSERVWAVVGSKGAHYTVRANHGRYTCTCPGFGWRRKCKHIEQVKKENRDKS